MTVHLTGFKRGWFSFVTVKENEGERKGERNGTNLCNHWSRSWAVLQLKYLGPPVLGVTWKQWGLPSRLGCSGVTAARSIEVTACPQRRDSCERQPRSPAPRCFCRSSFVTLFVLFNGFERNDLFEKKFCGKRERERDKDAVANISCTEFRVLEG